MNNTKPNAMRPAAPSLLSAFRSSGKRHLILTGARGSGKTTLLRRLLPDNTPGFITEKNPAKQDSPPAAGRKATSSAPPQCDPRGAFCHIGNTVSYMTEKNPAKQDSVFIYDRISGASAVIGHPASASGRMIPVPEGFRTVGLAAVRHALDSESPVVCIDELGYLEEQLPWFCDAVWKLFERKQVFAVLRGQSLPFLDRLRAREDAFVFDLSATLPKIGAIVMASGSSSRWKQAVQASALNALTAPAAPAGPASVLNAPAGAASSNPHAAAEHHSNKLLADFHGEPLAARALRAAASPLISRRIAVTRLPEIQALCSGMEFPCLLHRQPLRSDTIRLGIESMEEGDVPDGCLFFPGDQPLVSEHSIEALILAFAQDPRRICRLAWEGRPGSPVLFPRSLFGELRQLLPDQGGSAVIRRYPELVRTVNAQHACELMDADTPEALAALLEFS